MLMIMVSFTKLNMIKSIQRNKKIKLKILLINILWSYSIFTNAQDINAQLYTKAIENYLTDKSQMGVIQIQEDYQKFDNVIICLEYNPQEMPNAIANFNILYLKEENVCDYLQKNKQDRRILSISPIVFVPEQVNNIYINITYFFMERNKRKNCIRKIRPRGFFEDYPKIYFTFNCTTMTWELKD